MKETEKIADQLERAWDGAAWHGPPIAEILKGVTAAQAASHPIPNCHSIWELVLHSAAWAEAARRSISSGVTQVSEKENFPPIPDAGPQAWDKAKARLQKAHQDLAASIRKLQDSDLSREIRGEQRIYSFYVLFHGVVQHSLYHAGQMIVLRKALAGD